MLFVQHLTCNAAYRVDTGLDNWHSLLKQYQNQRVTEPMQN